MAELLVHYDGAVRHVIAAEYAKTQQTNTHDAFPASGGGSEILNLSGEAIAALADADWTG